MSQVAPGIIRIEERFTAQAQPLMENVYYARAEGPVSEAELSALAASIVLWETADASPLRGSDIGMNELVLTDLTSLDSARISSPVAPPIVGGAVEQSLPFNVTWAAKADIGKRGRGKSGRSYWIGLHASQISGEFITSAAVTAILAALEALQAAISGVTGFSSMCVPHFVVGGARPPTVLADDILRWTLSDQVLDSRKERLPYHNSYREHKHIVP